MTIEKQDRKYTQRFHVHIGNKKIIKNGLYGSNEYLITHGLIRHPSNRMSLQCGRPFQTTEDNG